MRLQKMEWLIHWLNHYHRSSLSVSGAFPEINPKGKIARGCLMNREPLEKIPTKNLTTRRQIIKQRLVLFFLGILALCFTSGCASLISGSTQPVTFNSSPDGASVTLSGQVLGKTPVTIVLKI